MEDLSPFTDEIQFTNVGNVIVHLPGEGRRVVVFEHYGSDSVSMIAGGAKPNLIGAPCRYSHSPNEMVHLDDLENTVRRLYHYVTEEHG